MAVKTLAGPYVPEGQEVVNPHYFFGTWNFCLVMSDSNYSTTKTAQESLPKPQTKQALSLCNFGGNAALTHSTVGTPSSSSRDTSPG